MRAGRRLAAPRRGEGRRVRPLGSRNAPASTGAAWLLLLALGMGGCRAGNVEAPPRTEAPQEVEGVPEGVLPAPGPDPVLPDPWPPGAEPVLEPPGIGTVATEPVQGWMGPGGRPFEVTLRTPGDDAHLHARIGRRTFALPARLSGPALVQYPCTSCHEGVVLIADRIPDAHRNIQPLHPSATGATCSTCHVPAAVERLVLPEGGTVSMDHAYRLCAQCHAPQLRDWAGGTHGKRLEGWAGRRVVMNCADCHDPHNPGLERRTPFPGPQLPTSGARP